MVAHLGWDSPLIAIAACESNFQQYKNGSVLHGTLHKADTGVLQLNMDVWADKAKELGYEPRTLFGNLQLGEYIYETQGLKPWSSSKACWGPKLKKQLADAS